jgi:hypothetical protein
MSPNMQKISIGIQLVTYEFTTISLFFHKLLHIRLDNFSMSCVDVNVFINYSNGSISTHPNDNISLDVKVF